MVLVPADLLKAYAMITCFVDENGSVFRQLSHRFGDYQPPNNTMVLDGREKWKFHIIEKARIPFAMYISACYEAASFHFFKFFLHEVCLARSRCCMT